MNSLWMATSNTPDFPQLLEDISTDVLVIGGGMAGLLTAYYLQQKGIDTVIVEKDKICSATTSGTTAKITAQHGLIYHKISKSYNETFSKMYYKANAMAVDNLKELCKKVNCNLENKNNFVYSFDKRKIEVELNALEKIGVKAIHTSKLPFNIKADAIGFENQGQFNPLKLAEFLSKQLNIYERTKVEKMIDTTALTKHGRIKAKKIIVATHFPFINKHGSYFLKLYQHRSYMLALNNTSNLNAMYVDDNKKGISISSFGDYLLLGGGGHRTGKQGGNYSQLRSFAKSNIPKAKECFHWTAQDTMSLDGIPYIGQYSKSTPNLYVATGFNKWGMTSSMVSAQILSAMINDEYIDYFDVFSPSRSILKPQLFINGLETTKNLLTPTTPRCPHLGCALKYNKCEHSWDCACHGSRFSQDGKLLDNPANNDLKTKQKG